MKTIFIGKKNIREFDMFEFYQTKHLFLLMNEYKTIESPVMYFFFFFSKIKEVLIKKVPTISA
jgi:hypothetical protein